MARWRKTLRLVSKLWLLRQSIVLYPGYSF